MWFQRLSEFLRSLEFKESYTDPSLFIHNWKAEVVYLFIYEDNIVISGSDGGLVNGLITQFGNDFLNRDLGDFKFFLGIQVRRTSEGLHLSQTQYLVNLLQNCDMRNLKLAVTPVIANQDMCTDEDPIDNVREYCHVVGLLQYLALTHPDV